MGSVTRMAKAEVQISLNPTYPGNLDSAVEILR